MALETSLDLEEEGKSFNYDLEYDETLEEDLVEAKDVEDNSLLGGLGGFLESNYSLLFFFLLLVIIFNGSGTFSESNETLLFFFLILVIIFTQFN